MSNGNLKPFYWIICLGILPVLLLFQNCAPSFSSSDSGTDFFKSEIPGFGSSPSKSSFVINETKFQKLQSEFTYNCENPEAEIPRLKPSKLTKEELKNSIKTILGLDNLDLNIYPSQSNTNKFKSSNLLRTENTLFSSMTVISELVANEFIKSLENQSNPIWECDFSSRCVDEFYSQLPNYVWRKNISFKEQGTINQLKAVVDSSDKKEMIRSLVSFLLQSPQFYIKNSLHISSPSLSKLSPVHLINRLSFFLTSSAPTIELMNKYYGLEDISEDKFKEIAQEILSDQNAAKTFIKSFLISYLSQDRAIASNEKFNNRTVSSFVNEDISNLVNSFYKNEPLSALISNVKSGILTNTSFSYSTFKNDKESSPIRRGTTILSNVLCEALPTLSAATLEKIKEVENSTPVGLNNIEVMAYHRSIENCASCHNVIDPPAIGLEVMGPFGQIRDRYSNGDKILTQASLGKHSFNSLDGYLNIMSKSIDFKSCFANHLNSAVNYSGQTPYNSCLVRSLYGENEDAGLMDIVFNFVTSNNFLRAKVPTFSNGEMNIDE